MHARTAAMALAALACLATPAHARPRPVECGLSSIGDPTAPESDRLTAVVNGGPVRIGTRTGSLVCTIQMGAATHAGADAAVVRGPETRAAVAAAGVTTFSAPPEQDLYLCTEVDITGGAARYLDGVTGAWSADPTVPCVSSVQP